MSDLNLGHLIKTNEQVDRDAIHVAVAPVTAAETLNPGERVGLLGDGTASASASEIGIVDPYLVGMVRKGQRFWLFLFPKTITNLRHHWTHPAFEAVNAPEGLSIPSASMSPSERWIRQFAERLDVGYRTLMEGAAEWVRSGDYLCLGGLLEGETVPEEFWRHYEIVTGVKGEGSFFTCSC